MMWIYDIPTWTLGVLVVTATVGTVLGGFFLIHRLFPGDRSSGSHDLVLAFVGIVCAFHSLLIAFSAVLVWQDFQDSEAAVATEANTAAAVFRDLGLYGGDAAQTAQVMLTEYVRSVIEEEWPLMADGGELPKAQTLLDEVFKIAGKIEPETPRQQVIFAEMFRHLNALMNNRHERIHDAQAEMSGLFWAIVLVATALLVGYIGMLPITAQNVAMISGMAIAVGLIFFFILAMDHPFAGETAVESLPFQELLQEMEVSLGLK